MKLILENTEIEQTLFNSLRGYIRKLITSNQLRDSDNNIYRVINSGENLAQSEIIFDLDGNDKFFELLDIDENDAWFASWVTNNSSSIDVETFDSLWDDFMNGYGSIFYRMNDENKEKISEIMVLLSGIPAKFKNESDMTKIAEILNSFFPYEAINLVDEYKEYLNEEIKQTAEESIMIELNSYLENIGFSFHSKFDMIKTTPANLLMWYTLLNSTNSDFMELFTEICDYTRKKLGRRELGGWSENQYEFRDPEKFDEYSYNYQVEKILDKILGEIEENPKYQKWKEELLKITSKFDFNTLYPFRTNKNYKFKILEFNSETGKLSVNIFNFNHPKNIDISIDGFLKIYEQPALFDIDSLFD